MTIDEKVRHDLYEGLEEVVGEVPAKLLMTAIPPFSWDNVATNGDISELKGDISELRSYLNGDIDLLRDDNKGFRGELRDIRTEISELRREMVRDHRWLLFQLLAVNLLMVVIVVAFVAIT
jgi:hypothetical protein